MFNTSGHTVYPNHNVAEKEDTNVTNLKMYMEEFIRTIYYPTETGSRNELDNTGTRNIYHTKNTN